MKGKALAGNIIVAGILLLTALAVGFLSTHHAESYNCHYSADADAKVCSFRYIGNN